MRAPPRTPAPLAALAILLAGCGAGGQPQTGATTHAAAKSSAANEHSVPPGTGRSPRPPAQAAPNPGPPAAAFHPKPHHDSAGAAAQFIVKGADNSVQEFGAEASESELQEAAAALHDFLDARAQRSWAAACAYLSKAAKQGFAQLGAGSERRSCAATLAALSGKVPTATLREAAVADVGSLRTEGGRGFLIYRGAPRGTIYAMPVAREAGGWKVASLAGTPLD